MTDAQLIDGKAIAADVRATVAKQVAALKHAHGLTPGLAVVLVGEDPASQIYVRNKGKQSIAAGMQSFEFKLPADTTQDDLLAQVAALNADPAVHGILVQMPLPGHLDENAVVNAIDPDKDVDGLHPVNAGRLSLGEDGLVPCTPRGCMILLDRAGAKLEGADAVVIITEWNQFRALNLKRLREEMTTPRMADLRNIYAPEEARKAGFTYVSVGR